MSQRLEHIDLLLEELERYGLAGQVGERGKHLEVRWKAPLGERFVIAPRTPSDWRSAMNTRSDLRKLLRADGLEPKAPQSSFQRAMSLPTPPRVDNIARERALLKDVEALTEMVFELEGKIESMKEAFAATLREQLMSLTVVSRVEFKDQKVAKPRREEEFADIEALIAESSLSTKSKKDQILALLSFQYRPVSWVIEQAKDISTPGAIRQTLKMAKRDGLVETGLRGMYRLKPKDD